MIIEETEIKKTPKILEEKPPVRVAQIDDKEVKRYLMKLYQSEDVIYEK